MTKTGFEQQCPCGATITVPDEYKDGMATHITHWNNCHQEHYGVTFQQVSAINAKRANRWHSGFPNHEDGWTGADWSNAMCGEAGETANVVKKLRRLDTGIKQAEQGQEKDKTYEAILKSKLATEIGDTFLYLDLLAQFYGLSMEDCVAHTFNRVSEREGFPEKIDG